MVSSVWDLSGVLSMGHEASAVQPCNRGTVHWFLLWIRYHLHYSCPPLFTILFSFMWCNCFSMKKWLIKTVLIDWANIQMLWPIYQANKLISSLVWGWFQYHVRIVVMKNGWNVWREGKEGQIYRVIQFLGSINAQSRPTGVHTKDRIVNSCIEFTTNCHHFFIPGTFPNVIKQIDQILTF